MNHIKVLGTGCPKCKTTYYNVMEALKTSGQEAEVIKIEDIQEIMKYNVLSTPVLIVNDEIKAKGRVAGVSEISSWLTSG